jgi:hypothetical protein
MKNSRITMTTIFTAAALACLLVAYGCGDGGGGCPEGQQTCNNTCVNVQTDSNNCGGCGHSCNGAACVNGRCACPTGQTDCSGVCVDTQTSNSNCGSCGNVCPAGTTCTAGTCQCPSGQTLCTDTCVDTQTDEQHCGNCTTQCAEVQTCVAGACQCPSGQTLCGTECVDTQTDKRFCGNCATACAAAQDCVAGHCQCPGGKELCGDQCVDTQTDSRNCGTCGHACDSGFRCSGGTCQSLGCAVVPDDAYETPAVNDSCAAAKALPNAPEGAGVVTIGDATLHHQSGTLDQDWFTVYADEATHICWPGDDQCNFYFDISLTLPTTVDHTNYEMCVGIGDCPTLNPIFCTEEADWNDTTDTYTMTLMWQGTCGLDDAWTFYVKVSKAADDDNCDQYTLSYRFYFLSEACPT